MNFSEDEMMLALSNILLEFYLRDGVDHMNYSYKTDLGDVVIETKLSIGGDTEDD